MSAGHLRRDRTEVLTERAQKTAQFCTPAPGARTAVRSDSSSGAMRRLLCAPRNDGLFRCNSSILDSAGLRPAGSHCENSGSSDGTGASARSGCANQRSLLCPLSERGYRHPLLFAVLDLLVLLDQAKSTRKTEKGENFPIDSSGRIPRFRRCIRRPFSFPDFSQGGAMGALRSHCLRYFSYL